MPRSILSREKEIFISYLIRNELDIKIWGNIDNPFKVKILEETRRENLTPRAGYFKNGRKSLKNGRGGALRTTGLVFPLTWPRLIFPFYHPAVLSAVKGNREWTFQSRRGFFASNLLPISPGYSSAAFESLPPIPKPPSPSISMRRVYRTDRESRLPYVPPFFPYSAHTCIYIHS